MGVNKQPIFGMIVSTYSADEERGTMQPKNIGDYVQSIAAAQFYPHVDEKVERDDISNFKRKNSDIVKVILNGWWMWRPDNWPPASCIKPLPISIHMSPVHAEEMLSPAGIQWFKKHEPIGCRDYDTMHRLQSHGIESYYSSCLTLTLYKSYPPVEKQNRKGICFVDPYYEMPLNRKEKLLSLLHILRAPITILSLCMKEHFKKACYNAYPYRKHKLRNALIGASSFHKQYSSFFSNKVLRSAAYLSHIGLIICGETTDEECMKKADSLLRQYQSKMVVVTSRIHVALPCLAMQTPVIFIKHEDIIGREWRRGRLSGIEEFLRCLVLKNKYLEIEDEALQRLKYNNLTDNIFENKTNWIPFAKKMEKQCEDFCKI